MYKNRTLWWCTWSTKSMVLAITWIIQYVKYTTHPVLQQLIKLLHRGKTSGILLFMYIFFETNPLGKKQKKKEKRTRTSLKKIAEREQNNKLRAFSAAQKPTKSDDYYSVLVVVLHHHHTSRVVPKFNLTHICPEKTFCYTPASWWSKEHTKGANAMYVLAHYYHCTMRVLRV